MMIQKRKVLLLVTCFMMIGLIASLISGCGGGGGGGGGGGTETPQYGGFLHTVVTSDPLGWDDATTSVMYGNSHAATTGTYQCLYSGDWTKGKAGGYGTSQLDWFIPGPINRLDSKTGYIAQSWDIGTTSITFHLRAGVRWENRNPTKGRAVTADDVVYSINRNKKVGCYLQTSYKDLATAMNAVKVDESTVRIDCTAAEMPELLSMIDFMYIYPQDVVEEGDITDWTMSIGCGPFYIKQYTPGSTLFFAKNTVYWETNPIGPGQGDQLPYIDGVYNYIQTDPATMDSLFKTGQVDIIECEHDRALQIKAACPDAKYVTYFSDAAKAVIAMQINNPDLPYKDLRVRQALMLAIDHQKMVNEMYGGEGGYLYWPLADTKEYADAYLTLSEYPTTPDARVGEYGLSLKDLLTYNPTKAKQLLADAGYPDGFKAKINVWNFYLYLEQLEVVKDMWKDIGVDLEIKVEPSLATIYVYQIFHSFDNMLYAGISGAGNYFKGIAWATDSMWNASHVNDPILNDYRNQMLAAYPDDNAMMAIHRELLPYLQEQCYVISVVGPMTYRFWWPWVKNYDGEGSLGYYKYYNNGYGGLSQYIWIDQALKTSMGF
ncbi:MAG: ABC transporter substrate-binding protein [Dehalococcoidia bacterium]